VGKSEFDAYVRQQLPIETELRLLYPATAPLTILDVGACEGEDSIRYQLRFPQATVHAFEPLPANVQRAREHFAAYGLRSIRLEQVALADKEGEATMHVLTGRAPGDEGEAWQHASSSLLAPSAALGREYPWLSFGETLTVPVTTLARYAAIHAITDIDLLHLDVQGAELKVLGGAGSLLERVKVVWLEAEAVALYEGQPLCDAVEEFMEGRGFVKVADTVGSVAGDQLYIQPKWFPRARVAHLRLRHEAKERAPWIVPLVRRLKASRHVRARDVPGRAMSAARHRAWSRRGRQFYRQWIHDGDLCFDVGANMGERAKFFLDLGARVVAVEPQPACVAALREIRSDRLAIEEVALGDAPGTATLRVAQASYVSSLAKGWIERVRESGRFAEFDWRDTLEVRVSTLDDLIARYGTPAFCKIDVEGYEAEVVEGLSQPLPALSFEFTAEWSEAAERTLARLELLGFTRFNFSVGESLSLEWPEWRDADALRAFLASAQPDELLWGDVYACSDSHVTWDNGG
jgi:FkbM family methyltransferase